MTPRTNPTPPEFCVSHRYVPWPQWNGAEPPCFYCQRGIRDWAHVELLARP